MRNFTVLLRPEPEGGFTVLVPELPEIVTFGKDEKEALSMAQDAIELVLADTSTDHIASLADAPRVREVAVSLS